MRTQKIALIMLSLLVIGFGIHTLYGTPAKADLACAYLSWWEGDVHGWHVWCDGENRHWACPAFGGIDTVCKHKAYSGGVCNLLD